MNKIGVIIIVLWAIVSGCAVLGKGPGKAKTQVAVTYKLGWWAKNANLNVESFEVKIIESNLNLFNTTAKVAYTITGTMKANAGWEPYIGSVHVSEHFENSDSIKQVAVVEVTPIMNTKKNKKQAAGVTRFKVTNEHLVNAYQWGTNTFRFVCGDFITELKLDQKK